MANPRAPSTPNRRSFATTQLILVLGGQAPGYRDSSQMPHMISHDSILFPIAVVCHNQEYRASLDRVLKLISGTDWEGVTREHAAELLYVQREVEAVIGDRWYPAPVASKPAIYSNYDLLAPTITGNKFTPSFRRCSTFKDALYFMLARVRSPHDPHNVGDNVINTVTHSAAINDLSINDQGPSQYPVSAPRLRESVSESNVSSAASPTPAYIIARQGPMFRSPSPLASQTSNPRRMPREELQPPRMPWEEPEPPHMPREEPQPPRLLKYTRSLRQITGSITSPQALQDQLNASRPVGVGAAADAYLEAHGYDAGAKLQIAHAYRTHFNDHGFINELCALGMAESEANWLFGHIRGRDM